MNSTTTRAKRALPTSYFLSSTNLKDAVIYTHPDLPLYRITSDTKHIKIYGTTPNRVIAVLHWRELLPDTIYFPQRHGNSGTVTGTGMHVNVQRWLKRSKLPDGTTTFTLATNHGPRLWKAISRYRHKVSTECEDKEPLALCYLHPSFPPSKPAFILQPGGEPLRDDIVVAYLVLRHRIMIESAAVNLFAGRI